MTQFHSPEHEELARRAIDPYRLLGSEQPESRDPEDIRHWISVYSELADFKVKMLAQMVKNLPGMPAVAAAEIRGIDMAIIRRQLARYEGRLASWQQREADVASATVRQKAMVAAERQNPSQRDISSKAAS